MSQEATEQQPPSKRQRLGSSEDDPEVVRLSTEKELNVLQKLLPSSSSTPVFIVEEHSEALLCLQRAMRRGVLPMTNITLIHYDAHPDLSLPQHLTSDLVYSPTELLDTLRNTESGIAEWIMPLVFAGHINQIVWIRSPWSRQLADGAYCIHVGEASVAHTLLENKYLVADCKAPYFANDGMSASVSPLEHSKLLKLHVTTELDNVTIAKICGGINAICLDICLDFFSTLNPFLDQLKDGSVPTNVVNIVEIFCQDFMQREESCSASWDDRTWDERLRRALLEEFMRDKLYMLEEEDMIRHSSVRILMSLLHLPLSDEAPRKGQRGGGGGGGGGTGGGGGGGNRVGGAAATSLTTLVTTGNHEHKEDVIMSTSNFFQLAKSLRTLDTSQADLVLEYIMWAELPSHQATRKEMSVRLKMLGAEIKKLPSMPAVVTIACSSQDGFISKIDVEWLISKILNLLQDCLSPHKLEIIPESEVQELYTIVFP